MTKPYHSQNTNFNDFTTKSKKVLFFCFNKRKTKIEYYSAFTLILLCFINTSAQIGVGTTTPRGALEINSTTNGVVPPQVSLTSIIVEAPVVNPQGGAIVAGTFVWNNATAGVIPNNVVPGLYYWSGTRWISFAGSPGGLDWSLLGNAGTNAGTDFLGTIDNQALVLKANSIERIRMGTTETAVNDNAQNYNFRVESTVEPQMFFVDAANSHVHIRAASPFPTIDMFTAVGQTDDYSINGYASGQSNAAVYGQHVTTATGANMNAAGAFDGVGTGFSSQSGWNVGIVSTGDQAGIFATSTTSSGDRQGGYFTNSDGAATQASARLAGYDTTNSMYYGGYFDGGQDAVGGFISTSAGDINGDANTTDYAWVGVRYGGTNYKIMGGGSVSTIVKDVNDKTKSRILFAPESPEITFTDSGSGKLINGKAEIKIDPILTDAIYVDDKHPLKVFIQLEGDSKGTYVTNKSAKGFTVKELQNGNSNIPFSWQLIANRADSKDSEGKIRSKHVDVRFPIAPEKVKKQEATISKAQKKQ
jgi:hypothetical protein